LKIKAENIGESTANISSLEVSLGNGGLEYFKNPFNKSSIPKLL